MNDDRGMTQMIALLLVLTVFVIMAFTPILFHVSIMKQTSLELAHHRALQLAAEKGYLTPAIIEVIRQDLAEAGFPTIKLEGVVYPAFPNSTRTKVLRGGNVHVELKYPAENIDRLYGLLGGGIQGKGFYLITGDDRSEALE